MGALGPAAVVANLLVRLEGLLGGVVVGAGVEALGCVMEGEAGDGIVDGGVPVGGVADLVVELLVAAAEAVREAGSTKIGAAGDTPGVILVAVGLVDFAGGKGVALVIAANEEVRAVGTVPVQAAIGVRVTIRAADAGISLLDSRELGPKGDGGRLVLLEAFGVGEEEQLVADNGTSDAAAELVALERARGSFISGVADPLVLEVLEGLAVEAVGAGLAEGCGLIPEV